MSDDPGYDTPYAKFLERDLEEIELIVVQTIDAFDGKDESAIKQAVENCRAWIEDNEGVDYQAAREWIIEGGMREWQPIETEPHDDSDIWLSDGETVWIGMAHKDGSLRLPTRTRCKFWMPADKPAPPAESP